MESLNLYQKLVKVMAVADHVQKNGYNDFHKYSYALEADIISAVKQELITQNVFIASEVVSVTRDGQLTTIGTKYIITNADKPDESLTVAGGGQGDDKGDKGIYKAITGAFKYFLLKTFMVSTGDDPEQTSGFQEPQVTQSEGASEKQLNLIGILVDKLNIDGEKKLALCKELTIPVNGSLSKLSAIKLIKALKEKEEIFDSIQ